MKHLFYIHSNITYLVAKAVIKYQRLEEKSIILLFRRNVIPLDEDVDKYEIHYLKHVPDFNYHINMLKSWSKLATLKKILKKITGGHAYFAYVPQTKLREIQILVHNRLCKGFSILEEGTDSYLNEEELRKQHKPRTIDFIEKLAYLNLVKSNQFIQNNYENVYGLSEFSFPGRKKKIVLDEVLQTDIPEGVLLKDKNLLIFDSVSIYNEITLSTHRYSIKKLLDYFVNNNIDEVLYKYHPSQLNSEEEKVFESLFKDYKSKLTLKRLDDNLIIEHIIVNGKDLVFYVNVSSLGMYAMTYGHKVYSFANYIIENKQSYANIFERYPDHYLRNVHFLD